MINKPLSFSHSDLTIINNLMSGSMNNKIWESENLKPIKKIIKNHYLSEQDYVCPYCQQKFNSKHGRYWDIEHIIPRSQTPEFMFEPYNLCMSCVDCNKEKSNKKTTNSVAKVRYPMNGGLFFIIHPHFDDYEENLIPVKPGVLYYPKTAKGRKTIEICGLSRFYEFIDYVTPDDAGNKLHELIGLLGTATDLDIKKVILKKIAVLSLRASID
ncbi:HNH endonuclease [Vibrio alginolyticus]|uniref:HNH endonuclease n=1 Tax=Vibrio alginolyticus TaxID=663 RepID=UPI00375385F8